MPRIDTTAWVRIGAGAFAVLAIAAAALEIGREGKGPETFPVPAAAATSAVSDPLAAELERCKTIAPASGLDKACERVWALSRRRFFGPPSGSATPAGGWP